MKSNWYKNHQAPFDKYLTYTQKSNQTYNFSSYKYFSFKFYLYSFYSTILNIWSVKTNMLLILSKIDKNKIAQNI